MSNDIKHHMDTRQVINSVYDYDKEAIRTMPHEDLKHEMVIDKESDSILAYAPMEEVLKDEVKECSSFKKAGLYLISGSFDLQVSPLSEGDKFYSIASGSVDSVNPKALIELYDICAKRIKLTADGEAYLVLQG